MSNRVNLGTVLKTFLHPGEYNDVLRIPGQSPGAAAVTRAGALAVGLGAAAALARTMTRPQEDEKRQEKMKAWAGARYPVMSIDPDLGDAAEEEKLRSAGIAKAARGDESVGQKLISSPADWMGQIAGGDFSVQEPGLALAAALGGIYGGYKLSDYIHDSRRKSEMDEEVRKKRNEIDKMLYEEYMRTRGLDKKAGFFDNAFSNARSLPGAIAEDPLRGPYRLAAAGYGIWGVLSLALAYKYSKGYHDKNDPARARVKQLQGVARERARQRHAPVMLEAGSLPDVEQGSKTVSQAPPKRPAPITTSPGVNRTPSDPSDPLGSLLG
jgi:hypothetical protein